MNNQAVSLLPVLTGIATAMYLPRAARASDVGRDVRKVRRTLYNKILNPSSAAERQQIISGEKKDIVLDASPRAVKLWKEYHSSPSEHTYEKFYVQVEKEYSRTLRVRQSSQRAQIILAVLATSFALTALAAYGITFPQSPISQFLVRHGLLHVFGIPAQPPAAHHARPEPTVSSTDIIGTHSVTVKPARPEVHYYTNPPEGPDLNNSAAPAPARIPSRSSTGTAIGSAGLQLNTGITDSASSVGVNAHLADGNTHAAIKVGNLKITGDVKLETGLPVLPQIGVHLGTGNVDLGVALSAGSPGVNTEIEGPGSGAGLIMDGASG